MSIEEAVELLEAGFKHPMAKMMPSSAKPYSEATKVLLEAYKECKNGNLERPA